jgi:hypothetical protein
MALSFGQIIRILMVAVALVALIVLQKPCAKSVSKLVTSFDHPDAGLRPIVDAPPAPVLQGEMLHGDMTPEQIQAAVERERARAAAAAGSAADAGPTDASSDARP